MVYDNRLRPDHGGSAVCIHLEDIASKYIIPGKTATCALIFLPSEAVYAEIHASLPAVIEESQRLRVYIVSPTTMMALLKGTSI